MADPKIKLDIAANVDGGPSVEQLIRKLEELSSTLDGDLARDAKAAGDALRQALAGQEAMASTTALRGSVTEAAKALKQAEADLVAYRQQMDTATVSSDAMVAGENRLVAAVQRAQSILDGKKASLRAAEVNLAGYGLSAKNAKAANDQLGSSYQTALGAVQRLEPAYGRAGTAATDSAAKQAAAASRVSGVWDKVKSGLASFTPAVVLGNLITQLTGAPRTPSACP